MLVRNATRFGPSHVVLDRGRGSSRNSGDSRCLRPSASRCCSSCSPWGTCRSHTPTPSNFSEPLSHTGALYFAVTVFSTAGFGDITPKQDVSQGHRERADDPRSRGDRRRGSVADDRGEGGRGSVHLTVVRSFQVSGVVRPRLRWPRPRRRWPSRARSDPQGSARMRDHEPAGVSHGIVERHGPEVLDREHERRAPVGELVEHRRGEDLRDRWRLGTIGGGAFGTGDGAVGPGRRPTRRGHRPRRAARRVGRRRGADRRRRCRRPRGSRTRRRRSGSVRSHSDARIRRRCVLRTGRCPGKPTTKAWMGPMVMVVSPVCGSNGVGASRASRSSESGVLKPVRVTVTIRCALCLHGGRPMCLRRYASPQTGHHALCVIVGFGVDGLPDLGQPALEHGASTSR